MPIWGVFGKMVRIFGKSKKEGVSGSNLPAPAKPENMVQQNMMALDNRIKDVEGAVSNISSSVRKMAEGMDQMSQLIISQATAVDKPDAVNDSKAIKTSSSELMGDEVEFTIPHQVHTCKMSDFPALKQSLNNKGCIITDARFPSLSLDVIKDSNISSTEDN